MAKAKALSSSEIRVSWSHTPRPASSCEITYRIDRRTTGAYENVADGLDSVSYLDEGLRAGTEYHYLVTGTSGTSSVSDTDSERTPGKPDAPSDLMAATVSSSVIMVRWDAVAEADGYEIRRSLDGTSWGTEVPVTGTTHRSTGLSANTEYHYQVRTVKDNETSAWTPSKRATTLPRAPTGVEADATSPSSITVSWNAVPGADRYELRRQKGSGSWGSAWNAGAVTSHADGGLDAETTYSYQVRTVVDGRMSVWSGQASDTTPPPKECGPDPETPTGVDADATSSSRITVTWNAALGADRYELRRKRNGGSWEDPVNVGTATSFPDRGLSANTLYHYQVRTVGCDSTSDWSRQASDTTFPPEECGLDPETPTGVDAEATSSSRITVTWDAAPGAVRYELRRKRSGGSWEDPVNVGAATSFPDRGLSANTLYHYQVRTVGCDSTSVWSRQESATTWPPAPTGVEAEEESWSEITVSWNAVSGADRYELRRKTAGGDWGSERDMGCGPPTGTEGCAAIPPTPTRCAR